jgi:hypothetical protein
MIEVRKSFINRRREANKSKHSVWYEADKRGGYIIYAGVKGTDIMTYAGSAMSKETLDYNIRKAQLRFRVTV